MASLTRELNALTLVCAATAVMWIPYTVARILTRGLWPALANPDPAHPADSGWAERARSAHRNAVENLAVFAPLVVLAAVAGVSTPATVFAARLYLAARIVHFIVYAAGIPVLRTLAFVAGSAATLVFAIALVSRAA